ncbi:Rv3235 family protein [Amycolatopsis aidingensis]|uniref:Rv3235 family protein n=1 Tax=Amycolatopsis aidingensis TaxID=2842453 RepID=UPI001C0BB4B9|nr:Rv3235 family protein [Amycolatopsis aidingensis]
MRTTYRAALRPLQPYEPPMRRAPIRYVHTGQLALDLHLTFGGRRPAAARPAPPPVPVLERRRLHDMLTVILEASTGHRQATQVRSLLDRELYRELMANPRTIGPRHALKSVHACQPAIDAIEACGRVHAGNRVMALVARFEEQAGQGWRCTLFSLLEPADRNRG